jgi:hypothetical protein
LAKHHYSHEKRMRELAKKKKRAEKQERRQASKLTPQAGEASNAFLAEPGDLSPVEATDASQAEPSDPAPTEA